MTTATAPSLTPMTEWDNAPAATYTTPMHAAGSVAYVVLAHSQAFGPAMARLAAMGESDAPEGFEDLHDFIYSFANEAGHLAYVAAQIPTAGFDLPWDNGRLRTEDLARAVAALTRTDVVETDQPFDPEWAAKLEAARISATVAA